MQTLTEQYLQQLVNCGGEIVTRADVIADLQAQGTAQVNIDRFLQGLELAERVAERKAEEAFDLTTLPETQTVKPSTWTPAPDAEVTITDATRDRIVFTISTRDGYRFIMRRALPAKLVEFCDDRLIVFMDREEGHPMLTVEKATKLLPHHVERYGAMSCGVTREADDPLTAAVQVILNTL